MISDCRLKSQFRLRTITLLTALITGVFGFWLWRYYNGPAKYWINYYVSSIFYEIFWCLVIFAILPKKNHIISIVITVFIITCTLEFLQLWEAPFLEALRRTLAGKTLIGTDFVWLQFPFYVIGCLIGWLLLKIIIFFNKSPNHNP